MLLWSMTTAIREGAHNTSAVNKDSSVLRQLEVGPHSLGETDHGG